MINIIRFTILIGVAFTMSSCIFFKKTMSTTEVNSTLPTLTASRFISHIEATEAVKTNKCRFLVKGRKYTADVGFIAREDLKYGAMGIDKWVEIDGGNAYALKSFKWAIVNENNTRQLTLEFDTLLCD